MRSHLSIIGFMVSNVTLAVACEVVVGNGDQKLSSCLECWAFQVEMAFEVRDSLVACALVDQLTF